MSWAWQQTKFFAERSFAFSLDSLHVMAGVLILFGAGLLVRKPISSWLPWFIVLALASVNEMLDMRFKHWPDAGMKYGESAKDLLLTMLLPTVLLFTSRSLPRLFRPGSGRAEASEEASKSPEPRPETVPGSGD